MVAVFPFLLGWLANSSLGAETLWNVRNIPRENVTVIAHRSAGDLAPENCLESLVFTWKMGGVPEVDVRTTKDGHIVMFHDGDFSRILPHASTEMKKKRIEDLTFEEVRRLDIGAFRGKEFEGQRVVSIEEICTALREDKWRQVYVDVKNVDFRQLAEATEGLHDQIILTTGKDTDLVRWHAIAPQSTGMLWMGLGQMNDADIETRFLSLRKSHFAGIHHLQIHVAKEADGTLRPSAWCIRKAGDELRTHGIELQTMPWRTKDWPNAATDLAFYKELLTLGSAAFGSDRPDIAFQALDEFYREAPKDYNLRHTFPLDQVIVQGHRGVGDLAPEGTMESFTMAWTMGLVPEADIRMTQDGHIVSFHDENFARVLPHASEEMKKKGVKDLTFEENRALDVGSFRGSRFQGQRMSSMEEMIEALQKDRRRMIYLDVKKIDFSVLAKATAAVHPQIILASSKYEEIKQWKKEAPRAKALLWMPTTWGGGLTDIEQRFDAIRDQNFAKIDQVQIHVTVDDNGVIKPDPEILKRAAHELRRFGVLFQTLSYKNGNKPETYWRLMDLGCASFATDYPMETMKAIKDYYRPSL